MWSGGGGDDDDDDDDDFERGWESGELEKIIFLIIMKNWRRIVIIYVHIDSTFKKQLWYYRRNIPLYYHF